MPMAPDLAVVVQSTDLEQHTPPSTLTTTRAQRRKNGPRRPTLEPQGVYEVLGIDEDTWAPNQPDKACTKFRSVCGYVGRERLNINLSEFQKLDSEHRNRIVTMIMSHFIVPDKWKKQVEHCAIRKATDAWRNWKHVLYKDYMLKGKEPFFAYTIIRNPDSLQFKREGKLRRFV